MATNFVAESWTYLAIDLVVIGIRLGWRIRSVGVRKLAADDYLMVVAAVLFPLLAVNFRGLTNGISSYTLLRLLQPTMSEPIGLAWPIIGV